MTQIQTRLLLPLLILLLVGISLVAWAPRNEAPPLRVAVPVGPASATFYVALEQDLFSPLRVKHQPFASGRLALDALLGGGAELALVAETPLMFAALNSRDFRILAVVAQSPHKFVRRSAPAARDGAPPKPTYGVPIGTAAQYWMERYLSDKGLTTSDVITLNIEAQNLVAALMNGSIAGFSPGNHTRPGPAPSCPTRSWTSSTVVGSTRSSSCLSPCQTPSATICSGWRRLYPPCTGRRVRLPMIRNTPLQQWRDTAKCPFVTLKRSGMITISAFRSRQVSWRP